MNEVTISKKLFGAEIDFVIYGASEEAAKKIVEEVYNEALRLQKIFNVYDPESELSKLNRLRKNKVSEELLSVIKKALEFSKLTKGSYDITLGNFILLRKQGKSIVPTCSYKDVLIKDNEISLMHPDVSIDLGSIAKGYITDKLAELLREKGIEEFLIDARGDICIKGKQTHVLGIQNPRGEGSICTMKLQNQSVATSGDYNQYVENFEKSHILNQKETISITVVAPSLEEADVYATALFTCDDVKQKKLLDANKDVKVLIIKKGNTLEMFNNFENIVYET